MALDFTHSFEDTLPDNVCVPSFNLVSRLTGGLNKIYKYFN